MKGRTPPGAAGTETSDAQAEHPVVRTELVPSPTDWVETTSASDAPPPNLMAALLADPVHSPERLALEAVRVCGPEAARWVDKARRKYPQATTADLAMAARDKFTRLSQVSGAATGLLGLPGAGADAVVIAWNKARMIVYLAALHHLDPTHEERAAEILYFTGVYKAVELAEKAVEVATLRAPVSSMISPQRGAAVVLVFSLGRMLGKHTVKKLITKAVPFGSAPISAWVNGRMMRELADQVVVDYASRLGVTIAYRGPRH